MMFYKNRVKNRKVCLVWDYYERQKHRQISDGTCCEKNQLTTGSYLRQKQEQSIKSIQ